MNSQAESLKYAMSAIGKPALPKVAKPTLVACLDLKDCDLEIFARYNKGFPGSQENPPEPAGYEIDAVKFRGIDVTDRVDLAEIHDQLMEDRAGSWE